MFATGHLWTTKIEVVEAEGLRTKTIVSSVEIPPSRTPVSSSLSGCHSLQIVPSFHHPASSPALPSERKYFHFLCRRQCLTWKASHSTAQKKSNLFLSKVQTQYLAKHVTYKEALRLNLHQNPKIKLISGKKIAIAVMYITRHSSGHGWRNPSLTNLWGLCHRCTSGSYLWG